MRDNKRGHHGCRCNLNLKHIIQHMQPHEFLQQKRSQDSRKGPPAENDRRPEGGLEALNDPKAARVGENPQLIPPCLGSTGRKQSEPLPTVEAG